MTPPTHPSSIGSHSPKGQVAGPQAVFEFLLGLPAVTGLSACCSAFHMPCLLSFLIREQVLIVKTGVCDLGPL